MYTYKEIAKLYNLCPHTIRLKIKTVLPLFRNFNPKSRKRYFNADEMQIIFKILGKPFEPDKIKDYWK